MRTENIILANKRRASHNMTGSPEYSCWKDILRRCNNPRCKAFKNYGGRGIKVCDRWSKFAAFFEDMGKRPSSLYTIERIDNNGDYCKENCRWATRKEQGLNRRDNWLLTHNGETLPMSVWTERLGCSPTTIYYRLKRGWSESRAVSTPV